MESLSGPLRQQLLDSATVGSNRKPHDGEETAQAVGLARKRNSASLQGKLASRVPLFNWPTVIRPCLKPLNKHAMDPNPCSDVLWQTCARSLACCNQVTWDAERWREATQLQVMPQILAASGNFALKASEPPRLLETAEVSKIRFTQDTVSEPFGHGKHSKLGVGGNTTVDSWSRISEIPFLATKHLPR